MDLGPSTTQGGTKKQTAKTYKKIINKILILSRVNIIYPQALIHIFRTIKNIEKIRKHKLVRTRKFTFTNTKRTFKANTLEIYKNNLSIILPVAYFA